jgi:hypothetical protein
MATPPVEEDRFAERTLFSTDPVPFMMAVLERALVEPDPGGYRLASLLSDLDKFSGDRAALAALDLRQWVPLLSEGFDVVQAQATRLGWGQLRRDPYA